MVKLIDDKALNYAGIEAVVCSLFTTGSREPRGVYGFASSLTTTALERLDLRAEVLEKHPLVNEYCQEHTFLCDTLNATVIFMISVVVGRLFHDLYVGGRPEGHPAYGNRLSFATAARLSLRATFVTTSLILLFGLSR